MKIEKLRIAGFRGFNELCEFILTPGLNTLYGPNGLGKTSFAEALEWLFFGETSKLRIARSKTEFRNSLRNLHYEGPDDPFVEVEVLLADDTRIIIKRLLIDDNKSKLFYNGELVENLEDLNVFQKSSPIPVVAQHALKEFIHSEPVKRWETISQMLRLESVSTFRNTLTTAITQFKNENAQTLGAVADLASSIKGKASLSSLKKLSRAIETFDRQKFSSELQKATVGVIDRFSEDPISILQAERERIATSYASLSLTFKETAFAKANNNVSSKEFLEQLIQAVDGFTIVYPQYVAASEFEVVAARIELLKQGLALNSDGDTTCPFCGEPTITVEKQAVLQKEVKKHETIHKLYIKSSEQLGKIVDLSDKLINVIDGMVPEFVPLEALGKNLVEIITVDMQEEISKLASSINDLHSEYKEVESNLSINILALQESFDKCILNKGILSGVVTHITQIDSLIKKANVLNNRATEIQTKIEPYLQKKALENDQVETLDALIRIWRNKLVIEEGFAAQEIIKRMTNFKKNTEEHEKKLTAERLAEKEEDILKWYDILNPNEEIRFARMGINSSGTRRIDLMAELYGRTANAAAMLSEAHINAMGISIYLGQVSTYSPFNFIVLDDPVQSMDADHTIRLQTDLIGELISQGYQVIVFSHLRTFIQDLRQHHSLDKEYQYEFASYHREGPKILENGPKLVEYLNEARMLRKGGAEQRILAAHLLRKALERTCKDIYIKVTCQPLPKKYESLTSSQLKELTKTTIPSGDFGKVSQILRYGDPASHDDSRLEPPTEAMIDSMLTQLTKLIVTHVDSKFKIK